MSTPQVELVSIDKIIPNPDNPRTITDDNFDKLVKSIEEFPEMLNIRPIVVNEQMMPLGGNKRYEAAKKAGLEEVPIIDASHLTEEQQKEFVIKDNLGFGEWDWNALNSEWDDIELEEWGLEVKPFVDEAKPIDLKRGTKKLVFEFQEEDCKKVKDALKAMGGRKEDALFSLLELNQS